jgi:hypothetical protein
VCSAARSSSKCFDGVDWMGSTRARCQKSPRRWASSCPHLRRALAEERAGIAEPASPGVADSLAGAEAHRGRHEPVRGNPSELVAAGTAWLERQNGLRLFGDCATGSAPSVDTGPLHEFERAWVWDGARATCVELTK